MDKSETDFVSRAGFKLYFALKQFKINLSNKICADFGASTGGFTDCLLQFGAEKIYSVDTSYGEFAWKLRNNPQVKVLEKTNAIHVILPEKMDLIVNDTGWTKQEFIVENVARNLKPKAEFITLIKPHYESPEKTIRGKLAEALALTISLQTTLKIESFGFKSLGFIKSPIIGKKGGNSEYIGYFVKIC